MDTMRDIVEFLEPTKTQAKEIQQKAQSEKDRIEVLRERELEKAKREAEKLINQAKQQASMFLLELEKLKQEKSSSNATEIAKKTRRIIKTQMGEMDDLVNPREIADNWDYDYKLPREPKAGDAVIIRGIGEGEILEVKNDKVLGKSGMLKTRVKLSDIMLRDKPKKQQKTTRSVYRTSSRADSDIKTEIDLRIESNTKYESAVEGVNFVHCPLNFENSIFYDEDNIKSIKKV